MRHISHWIDGKAYDGVGDLTGPVHDPATGELAATVAFAAVEDVDRAVAGAVAAFPEWRDAPVTRRQRVMFAYRELLEAHRHDLAKTVTSEHGKTLDDALGEVQRGIEVVEFACGIPTCSRGTSPSRCPPASTPSRSASRSGWRRASRRSTSRPWSRCGCSRWPSPAGTPSSSSRQREGPVHLGTARRAVPRGGAPPRRAQRRARRPGGGRPDPRAPDVRAVSFVGSTPVARHIYATGTEHGKRVQALGGAKNHMVVLPDADMELAADAAVSAGYGSAGERCMAISVVVAVGDVADRLLPEIERPHRPPDRVARARTRAARRWARSSPASTATRWSATSTPGSNEGADLRRRRSGSAVPAHEDGFFLGPCLLDRVDAGSVDLPRRDLRAGAVGGEGRHFDDAIG
jgi:malonate-semialdehyde dehydrogenase (acetylating) / methylmalonate-semialdehyde dehydrogenase